MDSQQHLQRLAVAVHEAGHAVMHVVLKVRGFVYVTIVPYINEHEGYRVDGHVKLRDTRGFGRRTTMNMIVASLAGEVAERHGATYHDYEFEEYPESSDRTYVLDTATIYYAPKSPELKRFLARIEQRTELLVKKHWTSIDAVARELLWGRTVTAEQVREVVQRAERMRYDEDFFEAMASQR